METSKEKQDTIVDTDILVDFLRNREPGASSFRKYLSRSKILISSISAFELTYGANLSNNSEKRTAEVQSLLQNHPTVSFDHDSAFIAGKIAAKLRSIGQSIEIRDLFNASICVSQDMPILTRNKNHYERIAELKLATL